MWAWCGRNMQRGSERLETCARRRGHSGVKCGSLLIIRPRPEVCVRVLGAWREKSLTDGEGQGEQSQWSSLERNLKDTQMITG